MQHHGMTAKYCNHCELWTAHSIVEADGMKFYICKKHQGELQDDTNGVVPELSRQNQSQQRAVRALFQTACCEGAD